MPIRVDIGKAGTTCLSSCRLVIKRDEAAGFGLQHADLWIEFCDEVDAMLYSPMWQIILASLAVNVPSFVGVGLLIYDAFIEDLDRIYVYIAFGLVFGELLLFILMKWCSEKAILAGIAKIGQEYEQRVGVKIEAKKENYCSSTFYLVMTFTDEGTVAEELDI